MAKHDRGVYEPSSDDIRVFDGGEDDLDEEGSRLPLLIVIALLVLAAFGGVVWLAYSQGLQRGREGAPQVITAEQGPVRTAPGNPGGSTPYQGLKIYEQPAPSDDESAPARSAATTPAATPKAEAPAKEAPRAETSKTETPAPAPSAKAPAKSEVAEAPKPVEAKPAPAKAAPAATPALPKPAPIATAAAEKPATEKPAAAGDYVLQIGAYKSEAEANTAWTTYQRKHPIVGGYAPDILKVDLGDKGTWYRVRIGAFADHAAANLFCDKLKADGGGCFLAKK
jgi:cell division protein FtsN